MPVPDPETLLRPLLAYGQDGGEKNIRKAIKVLSDEFQLTERERSQQIPSGKQTLMENRVHWARTHLDEAGAIKKTRRAHFIITDRGQELLQKYPKRIDLSVLIRAPTGRGGAITNETNDQAATTPDHARAARLIIRRLEGSIPQSTPNPTKDKSAAPNPTKNKSAAPNPTKDKSAAPNPTKDKTSWGMMIAGAIFILAVLAIIIGKFPPSALPPVPPVPPAHIGRKTSPIITPT